MEGLPAGVERVLCAFTEGREPTDAEAVAAVADALLLVWRISTDLRRIADALERRP